ncbi:hypothetical protein IT570_10145 [Candidatus Sumerlaeota bacterium]|nr:hypothetical protein [Candidatus Sumerlaeota bacterium]
MRRHFQVLILALSLLLTATASAQRGVEDRILVKNLKPSLIMERVDILAGLPSGAARTMDIKADDNTNSITIRIPESYKDPLERERLIILLRDLISRLDRPEPTMAVDLFVVQTNLLNDAEYKLLDETLRNRKLALERGSTAKGVVAYQQVNTPNAHIIHIDQVMREARAQTRPEPVRLSGRFLAVAEPDKKCFISADLKITAIDRPLATNKSEVTIDDKGETTPDKPIIFFSGELAAVNDGKKTAFPARHEVMVYVWASQQ